MLLIKKRKIESTEWIEIPHVKNIRTYEWEQKKKKKKRELYLQKKFRSKTIIKTRLKVKVKK